MNEQLTAAEYHADHSRVSNSMVKTWKDKRVDYRDIFITKTRPPRQLGKAADIGTVGHAAILEPHVIDDVCIRIPREVLNADGHRKGKAWTEFQAEHSAKILLNDAELDDIHGMLKAVYANEDARKLLMAKGPTEHVVRWGCDKSGLPRKSKLDKLCEAGHVVDVKTTDDASPRAFNSKITELLYDQQAAFYTDAAESLGMEARFWFVVVERKPPYTCAVYQLDDEWMLSARMKLIADLVELRQCIDTDDWREPYEKSPQVLAMPTWRFRDQWEVVNG